nr:peroxidase 5-like [Ziziphus jujuba var. spinosa]
MSLKKLCYCLSLLLVMVFSCQNGTVHSQLEVGFYRNSCRFAEFIVRDEVRKAYRKDQGVVADLLRMHFHDCFVRGCDGSVLIDSTPTNKAEKDSPPNNPSLKGFDVLDNAKARLEAVCRGVVSCADIVAFAARYSVQIAGGLAYDVPAGRKDGRISLASEALTNIPSPTFNLNQLTQSFASKGLTQEEMVTLSGTHSIGRAHCSAFSNRLYNFNGASGQDRSLYPIYAAQLKQQCPQGSKTDSGVAVPMNPESVGYLDLSYYLDVLDSRGLFTSDQSLLTSSKTAYQLNQYASNSFL